MYISRIVWISSYNNPPIQTSANVICVTQAVNNAKKETQETISQFNFKKKTHLQRWLQAWCGFNSKDLFKCFTPYCYSLNRNFRVVKTDWVITDL